MKASDLHAKTEELQKFEDYENFINEHYTKQLEIVQAMIKHGVEDGRCIIGSASLEVHQTEEWGSTLGELANIYTSKNYIPANKLEIKLNTNLSLHLLKYYEEYLIKKIMETADQFEIEEDRFKPIFDKYIDFKYSYGGWY